MKGETEALFKLKSIAIGVCLLGSIQGWAEKDVKLASSQALECSKVTGAPISSKTERATNAKRSNDAYAAIELARNPADASGNSCVATYTLYLSQYSSNFKPVKTFSVPLRDAAGVDLIGFSENGSKVAADFWWSAGDYKAHRPVVYDLKTKIARMNELGDQITGQLPACAYQEELTGINDAGEVTIHVPGSVHVDKGCPDQGNWLLDSKTGEVRRQTDANPKPQP